MDASEAMTRGVLRRSVQHYLVIIKSIDWSKFEATVEFKESKGLEAKARIFTISGSGGTLYPPWKVGDVLWAEVLGVDLDELMDDRKTRKVASPLLLDKSTVQVALSGYMESGEPSGRKAATNPPDGGWLLAADDGSEIRFDPTTKEWVWNLASDGKLYLAGKINAKAVSVDGGTQTRVYIGDP